jgi:hypothetical protein
MVEFIMLKQMIAQLFSKMNVRFGHKLTGVRASNHIVRVRYQQAFFDTPSIHHFAVTAESAGEAVSMIKRAYNKYQVEVYFIATLAY